MITIVVGSNRKKNLSNVIGQIYKNRLEATYDGIVELINVEDMPSEVLASDMYTNINQWISDIDAESIQPASKFVFILPEYNGTFPGVAKLFLDAVSSINAEKSFHDKKAGLVGLSAGKFGNWLGLEHFGVVLNYLKVNVYQQKVSISNLYEHFDDKSKFNDAKTFDYIDKQIEGFLKF